MTSSADAVRPHVASAAARQLRPWLGLPAALVLGLAGDAAAFTYTLRPRADAMAAQAFPDTNYAFQKTLPVRNTATSQGQYVFLRFQLPALSGAVTSATLRLRVTGTVQDAAFYAVTMGHPTWDEKWLTWNNWSPGTTFTYLGSRQNLPAGSFVDVDVTQWVGATHVTFGVASGADVAGQHFSSKEGVVAPTLTIVTTGSLPACTEPQQLLGELDGRVRTGNLLYACDYKPQLSPSFGSWNGGSENLPVIAAAVALYEGPVLDGTDYRTWWQTFFTRQASTTGIGHVYHFKGSELFSNVYDASTVTGILVARFWAKQNGHLTIRDLARDYLRRTWYAWALATAPQPFVGVFRNTGSTRSKFTDAEPNNNCPTLAMASPRSRMFYGQDNKRWLTAKILGYGQTCFKDQNHKPIVDLVVARYPLVGAAEPDRDASGLSEPERTALRALIDNTAIPADLATVLGAVRMEREFRWLLWSDGRRATYFLGHQLNNNVSVQGQKHTVFMAAFHRGTRELDVLFAEGKNNQSCLDPGARRLYVDDLAAPGCSSSNWMSLPPDEPAYHFVLGPSGFRSCNWLGC